MCFHAMERIRANVLLRAFATRAVIVKFNERIESSLDEFRLTLFSLPIICESEAVPKAI
jgi:hypothetical protein